jgi:hypothetical protein
MHKTADMIDNLRTEFSEDELKFVSICIDRTDDQIEDLIIENGWDNM